MLFQFKHLAGTNKVKQFISTRKGGCSAGSFSQLNLSYKVGDDFEKVKLNRALVASQLGIDPKVLFFPDQCHTANIKIVNPHTTSDELCETDALISTSKGIAIGVLAADCVPLLFFDPVKSVIAAAHAGWKGTVQRISSGVIAEMADKFQSNPADILAGIGPAISQKKYEIDETVIRQVNNSIDFADRFYTGSGNAGRYLLDLQALNNQLLLDAGLMQENIETINLCTFENTDLFFSARRDGYKTGRFGAVIELI